MLPVKILVVDDAALIRDMIKRTLRRQFGNVEVEVAVNGLKAQSILKGKLIDLILCDWEMPQMDGAELLAWVKSQEKTASIPFIMVTSRGEKDHVVKAASIGVNGYLTKPFTNEQLLITVMKALKKKGKLKQAQGEPGPTAPKASDSVSLLTSGGAQTAAPKQPKTPLSDGVSALMGKAHLEAKTHTEDPRPTPRKSTQPKGKQAIAHLRYKQNIHKCVIKDINLREILTVLRADEDLPDLLEQTVVHIAQKSGNDTVQLNGFVQSLTAAERKIDSEFVNVKVVFVDEDPEKFAHLSHFIQSM